MIYRTVFYFMLFTTSLLYEKCYSQPEGPVPFNNGKGFFSIGWSEDGKHFGYGQLEMMQSESFGSGFYAEILDLVSNKSVWHMNKEWWESEGGYYPQLISETWGLVGVDLAQQLNLFGIQERFTDDPVKIFPILNGDEVDIKIMTSGNQQEVYLVSEKHGKKKIFSGEGELTIEGYIPNHDHSLIAVVVNSRPAWNPYPDYKIIGCSLTAGFK